MRRFGLARSTFLFASVLACASAAQANTIIDLSAGGSGTANGSIYPWTGSQPTGSDVMDSFLRIDHLGATHTHEIRIADLVVKNISGIDYYGFLLDINEILMDGTLNSGSGTGDLFLYVPVSVFAGTLPGDQVYFYSLFSNSDAGFEEWGLLEQASLNQIAAVPEPGAMLLVGTGLLLAARRLRKTS